MTNFFIVGSGSWACAFGNYLSSIDKNVTIYGRNKNVIDEIKKTGINKKYLPDFNLNSSIKWTNSLNDITENDVVIIAISSQSIREFVYSNRDILGNKKIIILSKGIDIKTKKFMSQIVSEVTNEENILVISGPSHAEEVIKSMPTAVVVAGKDECLVKKIQLEISSNKLRLYRSNDILGVELAGAIKNIVAILVGVSIGLGFGDNTNAAIMTRGMNEIVKFSKIYGAKFNTFLGLSGFGDLIVTCTSKHSRNRKFGEYIGMGFSVEDAINKVGMVVEGYYTLKAVIEIAENKEIELPLFSLLYDLLYNDRDMNGLIDKLMLREYREE